MFGSTKSWLDWYQLLLGVVAVLFAYIIILLVSLHAIAKFTTAYIP